MQAKQITLALFLALSVAGCGGVSGSHTRPVDGTLSCDNFSSQESAQTYYDTGAYDAQNLDADGDGIACEEL